MKYILRLTFILVFFSSGCTKYLDAVPDKSLTVPTSIADYQALLENEIMFVNAPALGEVSTDDIYFPDALWATQLIYVRDAYRWNRDLNEGTTSLNWNYAYQKIYYTNIVLSGVERLKNTGSSTDTDLLMGWALFCRANAFYDLQEVFGQPYKPGTAATDLGIPLKLNTDLKEKVNRATVADTYRQILQDLEQAVSLLPANVSKVNRGKPTKTSAYALLARVYLTMQNYEKALLAADQCLKLYSVLLDYNTISPAAKIPFSPIIDEVIYNSIQLNYTDRNWQVDQQLYNSFAYNDLRRGVFFTEDPITHAVLFKGFYTATVIAFNGLATDEVYLIRAECNARLGNTEVALDDLNTLLLKRFKTGTYTPYTINTVNDVLSLVLSEKRKECIFRNVRWSDLRRLNQDPKFAKTLMRSLNGISYQLPPNDPRYALPIPDDEIRANGLIQNRR